MSSDISSAIKQICEEKGISMEMVVETIEAALAAAYRKDFGHKNQNIKVEFDLETGGMRVHDLKVVVEDELKEETERLKLLEKEEKEKEEAGVKEAVKPEVDEKKEKSTAAKGSEKEQAEAATEDEEEQRRFNPKTDIILTEAKEIKKSYKVDDEIKIELEIPEPFGRMAAQTAKQVIIQKLREAERDTLYNDFKEKEGQVISGVIQRNEGRLVFVDLGKATALLLSEEQIERERYNIGERYKFYILSVNKGAKGPEILVSRGHPEIVRKVFSVEIPEIANGLIEIKSVAREASSRTKIAVESTQENIDSIGSCVGQRGSRVQTIINELGGEKIDIIEYDDDPVKYISNALSPAKISTIEVNEEQKIATAKVKEDQLSLAIGKSGQNVRLAAKLTGWKIDVVADKEPGQEEPAGKKEESDKKAGDEPEDKEVELKKESGDESVKEKEEEDKDEKEEQDAVLTEDKDEDPSTSLGASEGVGGEDKDKPRDETSPEIKDEDQDESKEENGIGAEKKPKKSTAKKKEKKEPEKSKESDNEKPSEDKEENPSTGSGSGGDKDDDSKK